MGPAEAATWLGETLAAAAADRRRDPEHELAGAGVPGAGARRVAGELAGSGFWKQGFVDWVSPAIPQDLRAAELRAWESSRIGVHAQRC